MQNVLSFEVLTLKELGAIASEARVPRWSRLKKAELIDRLLRAGVVPPTVEELVARRRQEKEERAAEAAPLLPPELDEPTDETPTPAPSAPRLDAETDVPAPLETTPDAVSTENVASPSETPQTATEPAVSPPPRQEKTRSPKMFGSPTDDADRLVLSVCDPFWLRAYWEATPRLVERVRSAMGQSWHTADPTLRLYRVDREPHGATRREFVADFPVRAGVNNCYVPVDDPPRSFVAELGYLARDKRFFTLISSAVVETPQRCVHDSFGRPEENGFGFPTNFDAFIPRRRLARPRFASFENDETFRPGALDGAARRDVDALRLSSDLSVAVDCEIVVKGKVSPGARVRVKEEPIRLKEDGTFSIRYRLPERRHVFPVVATTPDGSETRTIVLAVDRNTKTLDPVYRDEETEE
ncbi:MAG: DUF4912 domain-containing protein [Thermoguttaceae bacterium]|nr:DUF4912 domain-containing protein [Thermoguttaceae bacterium]